MTQKTNGTWVDNGNGTKTFFLGGWEITATECAEREKRWLDSVEKSYEGVNRLWSAEDEAIFQTTINFAKITKGE